jgi:deferrochelatase/peroxidase EfeB
MERRAVLRGLVAAGGVSALAACLDTEFDGGTVDVPAGDPARRPDRQHAWNEFLATDDHGNPQLPNHHVFRSLSYEGSSRERDREVVETALLDLERAYETSNEGLLFTVGYSPTYFERFDERFDADLPPAGPVVPGENVRHNDADIFLHLASDHASVVLEAEEALFGDREANGRAVTSLDGLLSLEDEGRRTGFIGAGIPAEREGNLHGIPEEQLPEDAPNFMNFRAGFTGSQATEDRVTLQEGRFAGGTTQHIEIMAHILRNWFDHSTQEQVDRMFGPGVDAENVGPLGEKLTTDNPVDSVDKEELLAAAEEEGVVGHAQKMSRYREDGRPPILRRDVNTDDNSVAGVVFVSLQRAFEDFRRLRVAMAGLDLSEETPVAERERNGIRQYFRSRERGNFLIPPREMRALP